MPRVQKRKARKDYPDAGIKKGDTYYYWAMKLGPRTSKQCRQLTPPLPEQLTTSPYLQSYYPLERETSEFSGTPDDLDTLIEEWEQLRDEEQEKMDNMPEGLQEGPTGELIQERIDECQEVIDRLEPAKDEWNEEEGADNEAFYDAVHG